MNHFSKLEPFPLGAIHAEGFIKDQMLLGKDGMAGHLYELEPGMIADPFINKTYVKRWGGRRPIRLGRRNFRQLLDGIY